MHQSAPDNVGSRKREFTNERDECNEIVQDNDESFRKCKFSEAYDENLMENIIAGIKNDTVHEELLSYNDLKPDRAIRMCRESERTESSLESINEDCLRQIYRHLKLTDVINLAMSCTRLQNFANDVIFPKIAKRIRLSITHNGYIFLPDSSLSMQLSKKSLEMLFSHVEDLQIDCYYADIDHYRSVAIILNFCENLRKLRIGNLRIHELHNLIEKLPKLEELDLSQFYGIPNCRKGIPKVHKLILSVKNRFTCNFYEHFRNLSSLTIAFPAPTVWHFGDLAHVFDNVGHSLQHLKLSDLNNLKGYETIGKLITERLTKLESLELLGFLLTDNSKDLTELPHLKSLYVSCAPEYRLNSLIRKLSDNAIIEELQISNGVWDDEDQDAAALPLNFYKLRTISFHYITRWSGLLKTMIRSQMPDFRIMILHGFKTEDWHVLLPFIQTQKTLSSIFLDFLTTIPLAIWRQIIGVLKEPGTSIRPLLIIHIKSRICMEENSVGKFILKN